MSRFRLHNAAAAAIVALGLAGAGAVPAADDPSGTTIRDLYYGEVLFQFYQQKDFAALTHLLAARQAGRVAHHAAEAELLLGGLYLAYGQHEQAGEIFARLLDESADPAVHDRAWLFIGKARYERGHFASADEAFARVGEALPGPLEPEFQMLRAQSLMAQERFAEASAMLDAWQEDGPWLAYARYNLGVAMVRMQQVDEGARRLNEVGLMRSGDPELVALRDKANLALGYAFLQAGRPALARPVLERVRLDGPFSNKALLGVGWADAMLEDYRGALNPWLELQGRDLLDSAVRESLLAVPYAFSRLGADGSAAEYYTAAMRHFDDELAGLDAAIERARSGRLLPALLAGDDTEISRWYWNLERLPDTDDARYLYHLIADHRFQEALRTYRDLAALRAHLLDWQGKLAAFDNMVETRRRAYAQRLP
ncbi:MAG: tetratricopeptide repeat protein, partial [Gammaproteobacteria bacterium]